MAQYRHRRSTPPPPPPPPVPAPAITPSATGLQVGAYNANVGNIRASFSGWNADPTLFAGKTNLVYWENGGVSLDAIINGSQDAYIKNFASKLPAGTLLAPFHEMDLGENPWSGVNPGNSAQKIKQAWMRMHDLIGTKVKWLWVINNSDWPNQTGNHPVDYYPGGAYVDIIGVDGFQWSLETFIEATAPNLDIVLNFGKPVWITSTGVLKKSNQVAWITDALAKARSKGLGGFIYFREC